MRARFTSLRRSNVLNLVSPRDRCQLCTGSFDSVVVITFARPRSQKTGYDRMFICPLVWRCQSFRLVSAQATVPSWFLSFRVCGLRVLFLAVCLGAACLGTGLTFGVPRVLSTASATLSFGHHTPPQLPLICRYCTSPSVFSVCS